MANLHVTVVTPEKTALASDADFVALTLYDGELGIAPGHTPLIARLGFGELRLRQGGGVQKFYVDGGFVQVADNQVSVLTEKAMPASEIDRRVAEEQLTEAMKRKVTTDEEFAARDKMVEQARAQIRLLG